MIPLSYRSEVRASKIQRHGLLATADIAKDEIIAEGGHIVVRKTLREKITPWLGPVEIQIDDDLFIAPVTGRFARHVVLSDSVIHRTCTNAENSLF